MDLLTTAEVMAAAGVDTRRFRYLRDLFDKAFPIPARQIGNNKMYTRDAVDSLIEMNKDVRSYRPRRKGR